MVFQVRTAADIAAESTAVPGAPAAVSQLGDPHGPQMFVCAPDLAAVLASVRGSGASVDYRHGLWTFTFRRGTAHISVTAADVSRLVADSVDRVRAWAGTRDVDTADVWLIRCATNTQLIDWLGLPKTV